MSTVLGEGSLCTSKAIKHFKTTRHSCLQLRLGIQVQLIGVGAARLLLTVLLLYEFNVISMTWLPFPDTYCDKTRNYFGTTVQVHTEKGRLFFPPKLCLPSVALVPTPASVGCEPIDRYHCFPAIPPPRPYTVLCGRPSCAAGGSLPPMLQYLKTNVFLTPVQESFEWEAFLRMGSHHTSQRLFFF